MLDDVLGVLGTAELFPAVHAVRWRGNYGYASGSSNNLDVHPTHIQIVVLSPLGDIVSVSMLVSASITD